MSEKITLTRYLKGRGEVKALTHIEALAFGVPYPLQPGWPAKYGAMEITSGMIDDLRARIATARPSTASKAQRGLDGLSGVVLAVAPASEAEVRVSQPARTAPRVSAPSFPGFALRHARRRSAGKSAPWV